MGDELYTRQRPGGLAAADAGTQVPTRGVLDSLPVALCAVDRLGKLTWVNAAAESLLGPSASGWRGHALYRLGLHSSQRRELLRATHRAQQGDYLTLQAVRVQGMAAAFDANVSFSPGDGRRDGHSELLVTLVDVTAALERDRELARAQVALEQADAQNRELALLAQRSNSMVMVCDANRRVLWVNASFSRVTGYSQAEALGKLPAQLLHGPATDPDTRTRIRHLLDQGRTVDQVEILNYRKDGQPYWSALTIEPVRGPDGHVSRYVSIASDISERRRAEEDRRALSLAEAAQVAHADLLSRMSHKMRTPLNAILGFTHLLMSAPLSPADSALRSYRKHLGHIDTAGRQLLAIVDQAMELAEIDGQARWLQSSAVPLANLLIEVTEVLRPLNLPQHIRLSVESPAPVAWGDALRISEAVFSLLGNACKHSPVNSVIELRARHEADAGEVVIDVHDQGPGIPAERQAQLLQAFTKADEEGHGAPAAYVEATSMRPESDSATGLSLPVLQRLAGLMGGRITLSSQIGAGSIFSLHLPAADQDLAGPRLPPTTPERTQPARRNLPALDVLYVEDHELNRELLNSVLSAYPQISLRMASTMADGLAQARSRMPDVALLDIHLPDGHGYDLCQTLCEPVNGPRPLLVAMSADARPDQIRAALQAGFDHYLVKPLNIEHLLELLARASSPQAMPRRA